MVDQYLTAQAIMYGVLVLVVLWLIAAVIKRNRDPVSRINIEDLLLGDDGRMSKASVVMLGAFMLTTWLMIYLTAGGKMSEGYLAIYVAAWIAPTVTKLIQAPALEKEKDAKAVASTD